MQANSMTKAKIPAKRVSVYVPLDYVNIRKAVGGRHTYVEDPAVYGPLSGTVVEASVLKDRYANEYFKNSDIGRRSGTESAARVAANIRVGWMIARGVFPKVVS